MQQKDRSLQQALLHVVMEEAGSLAFQRKLSKARMELPHLELPEVLEKILPRDGAEKGAEHGARLAQKHVHYTTLLDGDYPMMLKQIHGPPPVLFYAGSLQALHRPCVSLVGSRSVTTYGLQTAKKLGGELAAMGFTLVSGLALGVDAAGHVAALEVNGRTAGILGCGVDRVYPAEHRTLAKDMVTRDGVVVSEFPPGVRPKAFHFPIRNRIISGLSHAVIVVEAKEKSGSLITARHCLDQGRELFAVPGPIHHETSYGTNKLIQSGEARLLLSVENILEELQPLLGMAAQHRERIVHNITDPLSKKIYEKLDAFEAIPLDLLVAELEEDPGLVVARLVELQSRNLVECRPGQYYVRNPLAPDI